MMMPRIKKVSLIAALLPLLLFAALGHAQESGMPPALVEVATASIEPLAPVTVVPGTVTSRHDARLAVELDGRLEMVAEVGARVKAGEAVAVVESARLSLRREELQAEVSRAQARLEFLEKEQVRFATLAKSNLAAATQLEQTLSERDVARGDLRVAQSRLAQNQDEIDRAVLRSPFDGVVVERLMMPGERASDGADVVRVVDQAQLEIIARAPLEYFTLISEGMPLRVRGGAQELEATVRAVVSVGDENTHQFEMRLDVAPGIFPVGLTVRVSVPTAVTQSVLAVPRDALVLRPGGITVYVIDADNTARQVPVDIGIGSGSLIEISGEVAAGDRVVVRGNERLQPGQPVNIAGG